MSMHHSFEKFSEKRRTVELKSVGNLVSMTVLVESANSLEEQCRTQCSVKYFLKPYRPSDPLEKHSALVKAVRVDNIAMQVLLLSRKYKNRYAFAFRISQT